MKVLVAMRDAGHILIDANTIRNYFHGRSSEFGTESVCMRHEAAGVNILSSIGNYSRR